jgi:hypothetical protein
MISPLINWQRSNAIDDLPTDVAPDITRTVFGAVRRSNIVDIGKAFVAIARAAMSLLGSTFRVCQTIALERMKRNTVQTISKYSWLWSLQCIKQLRSG